jgi:DNA-binding PadR family transcriptional regulator
MRSNRPAPRAETLLPLAPRDYLILFALTDGALHGHGLLKAIESAAGGVTFDPANLYRSLRKLHRDGLVADSGRTGVGSGGPMRRCYRLTRDGRAVLTAEARRLAALTDEARARRLVPSSPELR